MSNRNRIFPLLIIKNGNLYNMERLLSLKNHVNLNATHKGNLFHPSSCMYSNNMLSIRYFITFTHFYCIGYRRNNPNPNHRRPAAASVSSSVVETMSVFHFVASVILSRPQTVHWLLHGRESILLKAFIIIASCRKVTILDVLQ